METMFKPRYDLHPEQGFQKRDRKRFFEQKPGLPPRGVKEIAAGQSVLVRSVAQETKRQVSIRISGPPVWPDRRKKLAITEKTVEKCEEKIGVLLEIQGSKIATRAFWLRPAAQLIIDA